MSVFERLRETAATALKVKAAAITEGTRQEDIETWDSLGHVTLMVALESTFAVEFEPDDLPTLTSIPAILEFLRTHGVA